MSEGHSSSENASAARDPLCKCGHDAALPYDVIEPPFEFGNQWTVAVTFLPHVVVSTVRLTIDHGWDGTPLWFETMVFPHDGTDVTDYGERDSDRYTTEEQARAGHEAIVERWRNRPTTNSVWEDEDDD